ncbi:MAG: alpha/beta fold hydrolase BchO [Wenzhouxiangella sp.]|nr:alpha/beta fold hydrolase BchO [Wenzhouxiangella sp.]
MSRHLEWSVERATWPHADSSRFHRVGGLRWHVQEMGEGPAVLLVHGTGASTHSWRTLAPLLARHFRVIAPDLPGHGFTRTPARDRLSLPAMAEGLASLVKALAIPVSFAVGHSAGAAILIRACLDGRLAPDGLVSLNGALMPFRGPAGFLFPPLAKLLSLNPLTPRLFALSAGDRERVDRLIRGTGSVLDEEGVDLYARVFRSPGHVASVLGMMANWDLRQLQRDLPNLKPPLLMIAAENDRAVAPADAERIVGRVKGARLANLPDLGHLAHEENAGAVAELIMDWISVMSAKRR